MSGILYLEFLNIIFKFQHYYNPVSSITLLLFVLSTHLTGELFRRGCVFVLGKGRRFYTGQTHNFQYSSQILHEFTMLKLPKVNTLLEF